MPERGSFSLEMPVGEDRATHRARFDQWRRLLPRPLASQARFELAGDRLRVAVPLPASVTLREPYIFPLQDGPVDYAAPQAFRRSGDTLIAELKRKRGQPAQFAGVLALGDGRGLEFTATPGDVPGGGIAVGALDAGALLWSVLGALAGLLAAAGATGVGYFVATRVLRLSYSFGPTVWIVGTLAGALAIAAAGYARTRGVLRVAPLKALRDIA